MPTLKKEKGFRFLFLTLRHREGISLEVHDLKKRVTFVFAVVALKNHYFNRCPAGLNDFRPYCLTYRAPIIPNMVFCFVELAPLQGLRLSLPRNCRIILQKNGKRLFFI